MIWATYEVRTKPSLAVPSLGYAVPMLCRPSQLGTGCTHGRSWLWELPMLIATIATALWNSFAPGHRSITVYNRQSSSTDASGTWPLGKTAPTIFWLGKLRFAEEASNGPCLQATGCFVATATSGLSFVHPIDGLARSYCFVGIVCIKNAH